MAEEENQGTGLNGDDAFEPKPEDPELHTALPPKVESWRRRSATGAILTGFAMGLKEIFHSDEKPAIIMETSGDPPSDLPVEAEVEGLRPQESVVSIRPWLLPSRDESRDEEPEAHSGDGDD